MAAEQSGEQSKFCSSHSNWSALCWNARAAEGRPHGQYQYKPNSYGDTLVISKSSTEFILFV